MENAKINNELTLQYPDGFHEMTEEDLKKYFVTDGNRWGIHDPERHVVISVAWTRSTFLSYLTDAKSVVGGSERCMKSNLKSYQRIGKLSTEIASKKASGIAFQYHPTDANIIQYSEMLAFRQKNMFYVIVYLTHKDKNSDCHPLFDDLLKSIQIV